MSTPMRGGQQMDDENKPDLAALIHEAWIEGREAVELTRVEAEWLERKLDALAADVDRLRKDNVSAWHTADTVGRVKGEEIERLRGALLMVEQAANVDSSSLAKVVTNTARAALHGDTGKEG